MSATDIGDDIDSDCEVIADTLEASYSGSPSQSLSEGDPLQLECQVSSQTFQHTHLSVTWFLHGEEDEIPRPIITLDKDLTVKPGAGFEDGYRAGLISMDKVEDTTYRLKMPQVQQSDQGKFFCKAIEWIQDPDRSWTQIAHKTTTACNVEIKRIVAPDAGSFSVHLKASKGPLQEGDELDIRCSVNAQNLPGHFFSVTWLKNQQKVAHIGSSGVLTMFDSYKERENAAEMRAVKTSHTDYLLTICSARAEDQGQYQCEVWQENMNEDGTFKKIQKQMSSPETVSITAKEQQKGVLKWICEDLNERFNTGMPRGFNYHKHNVRVQLMRNSISQVQTPTNLLSSQKPGSNKALKINEHGSNRKRRGHSCPMTARPQGAATDANQEAT
ncbi:immunoglobulin superfamily member 2-like [Sinocyclocheilus rhinocerous]|uniref:immunoglobulin superfamily member 2-like n=1 Tax=Sinocyclocheilus rhinocerous TaxID=307959 RepID=UPI0007B89B4B|nr:PREDICTED: immunoglobulin superfamily member 2-like [Sinocyclocheilus rhinocerous]